MAEAPARVRVAGARMRIVQIALAIVIPVAAAALALTLSESDPPAPLDVHAQSGSYAAVANIPLSVTAFRIANPGKQTITIDRIRISQPDEGLTVIGALAYRGCNSCVADSAVPPHVTPPIDVPTPALLPMQTFQLKPGQTLTLLLSVRLARNGRVHVPPLRLDVSGAPDAAKIIQTKPGPELCAGRGC
jgi:hypothetical protein